MCIDMGIDMHIDTVIEMRIDAHTWACTEAHAAWDGGYGTWTTVVFGPSTVTRTG